MGSKKHRRDITGRSINRYNLCGRQIPFGVVIKAVHRSFPISFRVQALLTWSYIYGFMICFSWGNVSKSDIVYLLGTSFKRQNAIYYVLFHLLSFLSPYHQDWQCSRCKLCHQSGLQRKHNLKQNIRTYRMTSSVSKINLCCFKPLTNGGQSSNIYQNYKCISP